MGYGKTGITLVIAASLVLGGLGVATAKKPKLKTVPSAVTLTPDALLSGALTSTKACVSRRPLQVIDSTTGIAIGDTVANVRPNKGSTNTNMSDGTAAYSVPSTFGGTAIAMVAAKTVIVKTKKQGKIVKRKVKCAAAQSGITQLGKADLQVALAAPTSLGAGNGLELNIEIRNLGPSEARNVVLHANAAARSGPPSAFTSPSSPPGCATAGANAAICQLGTVAPNETKAAKVRFGPCMTGASMAAGVSAAGSTPDPAPIGDFVAASYNCP